MSDSVTINVTKPVRIPVFTDPIRGRYAIYVDGQIMAKNLAEKIYTPVTFIRDLDTDVTHRVRDVFWNGPTRFVQRKLPLKDTNIHTWVETDAPLTIIKDGQLAAGVLGFYQPGSPPTPASFGPHFGRLIVHYDVPTHRKAMAENKKDFWAVAVRKGDNPNDVTFTYEASWNGPTRLLHRPTSPIPGTNGRGNCYCETDVPVFVMTRDHPLLIEA